MTRPDRLNILLLCDYHLPGANANALADHINAFHRYSRHNFFVLSSVGDLPPGFNLAQFDALVVHYSICVVGTSYLSDAAKDQIAAFRGLKVQYIQDEYRYINQFQTEIDRLRIDLLFSCLPPDLWKLTYPDHVLPWTELRQTLTGYVPARLLGLPMKPIAQRTTDVFYRGRQVPFWIGSATLEKHQIGATFSRLARGTDLVTDIASDEESRVYGEEWIARLGNAKCTLGVESAASLLDFTGGFQRRTDAYLAANPGASFAEVEAAAFPGIDNRFNTAQISPRCFEACATKTCMILFEGKYSGILEPWRHFLPLKKDFSNFDEICAVLRDVPHLQEIVDRAYQEVALNPGYSYQAFVAEFDTALAEVMVSKARPSPARRKDAVVDLFRTTISSYLPEIGRLHGPLYFRDHDQGQLFMSGDFQRHCMQDIVIGTAGGDADALGAVTVRCEVTRQSGLPVTVLRSGQRASSLPKRVFLFFWRKTPYRLRLRVEPFLRLMRR